MKKQFVDDIAEDLGRISGLLDANIKVHKNIIEENIGSSLPIDSIEESIVLLEYTKGYLESAFLKLEKI